MMEMCVSVLFLQHVPVLEGSGWNYWPRTLMGWEQMMELQWQNQTTTVRKESGSLGRINGLSNENGGRNDKGPRMGWAWLIKEGCW